MTPALKRISRQLLHYAAFFLVLPLLPILTLGRILFFAGIDLWFALQARLLRPAQVGGKEPVLPFWLGWLVAVSLVAIAIALTLWGLALTALWPDPARLAGQGLIVLVAAGLLLGAYRAALSGTRALHRALVHNFALLIAYELDQLRNEAERQAAYLDTGYGLAPIHVPSLENREDIRNIFGSPTEEALSHLLASLKAYNMALAVGATRPQGADMAVRLAAVHLHLRRALQILGPHLRPDFDRSGSGIAP